MTKFLMFTKESCGPCGLVKKYIRTLKDSREDIIEEIYLDDFSNVPIPEENLAIAKKYGVTATPVLLVIKDEMKIVSLKNWLVVYITQNIRRLWDKYYEQKITPNIRKNE